MNYTQVLALIQQFIVANGNNEITANVLRPILEAILAQPNELIGDLDDLQTTDQSNLVAAINEALGAISPTIGSANTKIHHLSLSGIDPNLPELSKIAEAVRLHGPFTCDVSEQMVFKTITTIGNGSIATRYYRLIKNLLSIGGQSGPVAAIPPFLFMPDGEGLYQNPEDEGIIAELGNIGADNVWDAFNLGNAGEAWDMELYRFVRATQNGEIKMWAFTGLERFYGGPDMIVDPDIYEAFESDFFDITNEPPTPSPDFTFHVCDDIDELIIRQAEQTHEDLILVLDAEDDPDITFEIGETRRQAMYRLKPGTPTASLTDYLLVAVPYGNGGGNIYAGASPTTITVGGIPSGTAITGKTYDELFESLLANYVNPSITSFSISGSNIVEVGAVVSGNKNFTFGFSQSGNVEQNTIKIIDVTNGNTVLADSLPKSSPQTVDIGSVTKTTQAIHQWKIEAKNTKGATISRNTDIGWQFRYFFGGSLTDITDSAQARALPTSALEAGGNQTYNVVAGTGFTEFYFLVQNGRKINSVTDLSSLSADITDAYVLVGTMTVKDGGGNDQTYKKYKLTLAGAYSTPHTHRINQINA